MLFLFVIRGGRAEFVDQMLYEHFFHVYVETEKADKGKQFQEFLVFLRGVLKGCLAVLYRERRSFVRYSICPFSMLNTSL